MKIEILIMLAMAGFVVWFLMKKQGSNASSTAVINPIAETIGGDEGIVTKPVANNITAPVVTAPVQQSQPVQQTKTVYVAGVNPDQDLVKQVQSLPPYTPYATAKGYVYGGNGTTLIADGIGGYTISGNHRVVQIPDNNMLGVGQAFVPVSGGGYAIVNYDELPASFFN
jgi:hypothetical protein